MEKGNAKVSNQFLGGLISLAPMSQSNVERWLVMLVEPLTKKTL